MNSCLTCVHSRKPKGCGAGFAVCVQSGEQVGIMGLCERFLPLSAGRNSSPSPYNNRGTRDKLSFTTPIYGSVDRVNSRVELESSLVEPSVFELVRS